MNYQLISKDEVEYFYDTDSSLFDYPFIDRSLVIYNFDLYDTIKSFNNEDY